MIPIQLIIKGLYSYRSEQKIDFSGLTDARLFGIFGGVGSGKSTILEAISFALYEQSERLNSKDRRNYNMMNLKSDELLIDFIFKAGADDQEYRIRVETTRKKNKEEVNPFKRSTYKKVAGEWQARALDMEEIIGLSYDNFKRTIIIPQGKFQDFLQLKESERVGMMKEIFQLERFDLSDRVQSLASANKLKLENLNGRMAAYEGISGELISQKELELRELVSQQQNSKDYLERCRGEAQALDKLKNLYEQISKHKLRLKELDGRQAEFEQKEIQLRNFERFSRLFRYELSQRDDCKNQLEELTERLVAGTRELEAVCVQLENELVEFAALAEEYNQRERYRREAEEAEIWLDIRSIGKELSDNRTLLSRQQEEYVRIETRLKESERQGKALRNELDLIKAEKSDMDTLYQIKLWFEKLYSLRQHFERVEADRIRYAGEHRKYEEDLKEIASKYRETWPGMDDALSDETRFAFELEAAVKANKAGMDEARKQIDELTLHRKLEEYVEHLHEGDPCPLCGSTEHPLIMDIGNNHSRLNELLQKQEEQEKAAETLTKLRIEIAAVFQKKRSIEQSLNETRLRSGEAGNAISQHGESFIWEEYRAYDEKRIQSVIAGAIEQDKKEQASRAELERRRDEWQKIQKEKEECSQRLGALEKRVAELNARSETLKTSLREFKIERAEKLTPEDLKRLAVEQRRKYELSEKNYREKEQVIALLRSQRSSREGEIKTRQERRDALEEQLKRIANAINASLTENNLELREVEEVLRVGLDADVLASEINNYRQERNGVSKVIEELELQTEGKMFDETRYRAMTDELRNAEEAFDVFRKRTIELQKALEDSRRRLSEKKLLEQEAEKLRLRGDNLRLLSNLFRANGFVNYISSQYLLSLCNAANEKFYKLTRQRLRLEISENNEFMVRDFMNNGRTRSVKTLSGGQTFQASLCLALALADSIQQQNKSKRNFFFLDEGFGSQDKESLYLVFEALKALRRENRIVGIISHVEELQQEIGVYLKIRNDEERGSVIEHGHQE